jgi:hypothetical protein
MIIWGSTGREIVLGRGNFFCPQCNDGRMFTHIRIARYFTLYFIPLFQTGNLGQYVKCDACGGTFREEVLQYRPPTESERLMQAVVGDLEAGMPVEMAQQKLRNLGMDDTLARRTVEAVVGDSRSACPKCALTFLGNVTRCSSCGGPLVLMASRG